jgi:hypothetical protein
MMKQYIKTKTGSLSPAANEIIKEVYPTLQSMALGALPRQYRTSCGSCVRNVFDVVITVFYSLKTKFENEAGDSKKDE